MDNILQSYLVSLGFDVSQSEVYRLTKFMDEAERTVTTHTFGMAKHILKAQGAIFGAFTGISSSLVGLVDNVAMTDQSYRLLGMRMLMTTESARKLDIITKALGADLPQI